MPNFNPGQQALIDAPLDQKVVGVAGAGTGKTTTILGRTKRILTERPTGKIVLITFTRAAANDLKARLYRQIDPNDQHRIIVGTFHSVLGKLIRDHATEVGLTPNFSIIDEASTQMMIKSGIDQDQVLCETIQDLLLGPDRQALIKDGTIKYQQLTATKYPLWFTKSVFTGDWWNMVDNQAARDAYVANLGDKPPKDPRYPSDHNRLLKKDYTTIARNVSTMVNVAKPTELMTGQFGEATKQRLNHLYGFLPGALAVWLPIYYHIFKMTLKMSHATNTITYDQILFIGYLMIKSDLMNAFKQSLTHVIVDEYQDTNQLQDAFVRYIGQDHLTLVGDIDQAIYEFRGGDANLLATHAKEGFVVNLTINYRSFQPILDAANLLIAHNATGQAIRKPLIANRNVDDPGHHFDGVSLHAFANGEHDDSQAAQGLLDYINFLHTRSNDPIDYGDMAILIRSRRTINPLKMTLQKAKLPVNDTTGYADFMRSEVMTDMLNFIKVYTNPKDLYAFLSVLDRPKRGLGPQAIAKLQTKAAEHGLALVEFLMSQFVDELTPSLQKKVHAFTNVYLDLLKPANQTMAFGDFINYLIEKTGYLDWVNHLETKTKHRHLANLDKLKVVADEFLMDYQKQHQDFTLYDIANAFTFEMTNAVVKNDQDGITISTIHSAKGLEWSHVFLIGLEQENFPGNQAVTEADLETERRLMYVAATRAKDGLWIDQCQRRMAFSGDLQPSQFLAEMDLDDNV